MADVRITALPTAQALTGTELVPVVQNGLTVQTTALAIAQSNALTSVSSFSAGATGLTPSVASIGAVTLDGVLNAAHGGTGAARSQVSLTATASQRLLQLQQRKL